MSEELSSLERDILLEAATNEQYILPQSLEHRVAVIRLTDLDLLAFTHRVQDRPCYVPTRAGYVKALEEKSQA